MDRRQRRTREAIFSSFTRLLSEKNFNQITVGEIIDAADVGRATFYSHFETKDYLLKEFCRELFCHIFDSEAGDLEKHRHIFKCNGSESVFLHLFEHLQNNDNNILLLLSSQNNELFLTYFRKGLDALIESHLYLFESQKSEAVPETFWRNHIAATLVETVRWWIDNGMEQSPKDICEYFFAVV